MVDPIEPSLACPFYIGKGCGDRTSFHKYEANLLLHKPGRKTNKISTIHKLWKRGLDFEIDIILDNLTKEQSFEYEYMIIQTYGRKDNGTGILDNLTDGGEGQINCSNQTREKLRISSTNNKNRKGKKGTRKPISEETRRKMNESKKGVPRPYMIGHSVSDETRRKISEANKGKKRSEETRRKISKVQTGRTSSKEHCQKISDALIGHIVSNETRLKIRKGNLGKKRSEVTKRKMSEAAKKRKHRSRTNEEKRKISEGHKRRLALIKKNQEIPII